MRLAILLLSHKCDEIMVCCLCQLIPLSLLLAMIADFHSNTSSTKVAFVFFFFGRKCGSGSGGSHLIEFHQSR